MSKKTLFIVIALLFAANSYTFLYFHQQNEQNKALYKEFSENNELHIYRASLMTNIQNNNIKLEEVVLKGNYSAPFF